MTSGGEIHKMRMIFYHPAPIKTNASSASGIRPRKMLEAFRKIGFEVDEVCGYGKERKEAIARVRRNVQNGIQYSFAYGENTTLPFPLNEPSHFPFYPFLDYRFWMWLRKQKIPFGCFYRDVYWKFPVFRRNMAFHKWAVPLPFHNLDLFLLKRAKVHFFLPSARMADYIGKTCADFLSPLPPGCELRFREKAPRKEEEVRLFYVGGVLPPNYDLLPMIDFCRKTSLNVSLVLCCRKAEWDSVRKENLYGSIPGERLHVVHESGETLRKFWEQASIFLALWGPTPYRDFAMPFKVMEALGQGVPTITTKGTAAGDFVEANGIGWAIEPKPERLEELIASIQRHPDQLFGKCARLRAIQKDHTWEARAAQVSRVLTAGKEKQA